MMNRRTFGGASLAVLGATLIAVAIGTGTVPIFAASATCESLSSVSLPNVTITSAQPVAAGSFAPSAAEGGAGRGRGGRGNAPSPFADLPSFCRVAATLKPSSDSDIKIEVWMPATGWNGKFQAVGNGGWAGTVSYPAMASALREGYATASTDTGHAGNNASFALGHPEKVIDMGYRAIHEMAVQSKAIVNRFYDTAPTLAMFNGCSLGGRQAVTEAARYPADFDAIIAGASALYNMRLHSARVAINQYANRTATSAIPAGKFPAVHAAVLNACDATDGVKDGVIENPERCRFDPKTVECTGADGSSCLTAEQVDTARALYSPVKNPKTGAAILHALLQPGSELGWATLGGAEPLGNAQEPFKFIVFKDPSWNWRSFNPATDADLAIKQDNNVLGLTEPNLKPFFDRGGKLLMYHGWSDPQVAAMNSVNYFNDVIKTTGKANAGKSIQLYMVPGMNHCQGGPGTDVFDKVAAMESWVSSGRAPAQILASHLTEGKADRTRPLCPYGQVAKWKGTGSIDDAANFSCVAQ
jgi:Tannase and feruloyl esterase